MNQKQNNINKEKYNILSPDGFTIRRDKIYNSLMDAARDFIKWKNNFRRQGYYSSVNYGKIHPDDLRYSCELVALNAAAKKRISEM